MSFIKLYIAVVITLLFSINSKAQFNFNSGTQWKVSGNYESGWLDPNFDDASWVNATSPHTNTTPSVLPYAGTQSMWIIPYNSSDSVYCRIAFDLKSDCIDVDPFLIKADNGYVVYVNGVEIEDKSLNGFNQVNTPVLGFNSSLFKIGRNVICIIGINFPFGGGVGPHYLNCKGQINYTTGPVIDLGADKYICDGDTTLVTVNHNYRSYAWSDGQVGRTGEFRIENKYWCTARDTAGCKWVDTVDVFAYKVKPVDLGPDTSICEGEQAILKSDPDNVYSSYLWNTDDTTAEIAVGYQDIFSVTVTDKNDCSVSDSRKVQVFVSGTAVDLGIDTIVCKGDSLLLDAFFPQCTYKWGDGSTNSTLMVKKGGTYEVAVTNFCGKAIDEINVKYIDELFIDLGPDDYLCSNIKFRLGTKVSGAVSYKWNTGDTTTFIDVLEPGVYNVDIIDYCGNEGQDEIELIRELNPALLIPNSFTPNNDGINEIWQPHVRPKTYYRAQIINEWGQIVFSTTDVTVGWDGTHNGNPLSVGKYVYFLEWDECLFQSQSAQGEIQIIR